MSNKKLFVILIIAISFVISSFIIPKYLIKKPSKDSNKTELVKKTIEVETKPLSSFSSTVDLVDYPALVKNDQDVLVYAQASGNVSKLSFTLGEKVAVGEILGKIEDVGTNASSGDGIKNDQVAQSNLALEQAKKSLKLAEKSYENLKNSSEKDLKILKIAVKQAKATNDKNQIDIAKNQLKSAEEKNKTGLASAKTQRDLAKIQLQNALISLNSLKDSHLITSPFSGTVTKKVISEGETVAPGQLLLEISKIEEAKIQFFVSEDEISKIQNQMAVKIKNNNEETISGKITSVSPVADSVTKRFLIEAKPDENILSPAETIVTVQLEIKKNSTNKNSYILPLSTLTLGQNENYFFLAKEGKAIKEMVKLKAIQGEKAEIETEAPIEGEIIVEGNKLVTEGEEIVVKN